MSPMTIDAIYENGVLRPVQPLSLNPDERVTLTVHRGSVNDWPDDSAEIYRELEAEDRAIAESMWPAVKSTWPQAEGEK